MIVNIIYVLHLNENEINEINDSEESKFDIRGNT